MVSVIAFYSDESSLNPTDAYIFSVKFVFEKYENKQKEAGVCPVFNLFPLEQSNSTQFERTQLDEMIFRRTENSSRRNYTPPSKRHSKNLKLWLQRLIEIQCQF